MARITADEAQGWAERTKLSVNPLDTDLCTQIEEEVLSRLAQVYDTTSWVDPATTPRLVRVIVSKMYVAWFYDRQYSENQEQGNDYAKLLRTNAEMLITGILDGSIQIPGVPEQNIQQAYFYPNDASSAIDPDGPNVPTILGSSVILDTSVGPSKFSMGQRF